MHAVFRDTTSSYKFFWLLAILDQLAALHKPIPLRLLVQSMVTRAWAAVALFRLSLGKVDRLQDCVCALQQESRLAPRSSASQIDAAMAGWAAFDQWAQELVRFVPGRFLAPWFPGVRPYDRRGARDIAIVADKSWGTAQSGPYRLVEHEGGSALELAPGWLIWLQRNRPLLQAFAELELTRYLQTRNPSVPGIVAKLALPRRRSLGKARGWWNWAIARMSPGTIIDIYTGAPVTAAFEVDHFLPWSLVAHDEFWNLCPVTPGTNRAKSDCLPHERFLPKLAQLHGALLRNPDLPRDLALGYAELLQVDLPRLPTISAEALDQRYCDLVLPLAQIAANQGFPRDWQPSRGTLAIHSSDTAKAGGSRPVLLG